MVTAELSSLSDLDLLIETKRVAESERHTTAALVSLLAELDERRLYLGEGYSSLFAFCTRSLRLSEPAAYARITAARTGRRFPVVLSLLHDGVISLTTISLLTSHLTDENCERVLEAARHQSKREVERLVATIEPQPDIAFSVRALPTGPPSRSASPQLPINRAPVSALEKSTSAAPLMAARRPSVVAPIAPKRYLLRITVSEDTNRKLERARSLLRHQILDGDPAVIVDRALTLLLEFHHVVPFAAGGPSTETNLQLRCRAHNAYESARDFDHWRLRSPTLSGRS